MTIQEAIKSGKKFKRSTWVKYLPINGCHNWELVTEDILAEDYYLKPETEQKIELTRKQIEVTWENVQAMRNLFPDTRFKLMLSQLGFTEEET